MADKRIRDLLFPAFHKLGLIDDYIVETGTNGKWRYEKRKSGRMELTLVDCFTFTSGYALVQIPTSLPVFAPTEYSSDNNSPTDYRYPCITVTAAYQGTNRSSNTIIKYTPSTVGADNRFTVYGRRLSTEGAVAGAYWLYIHIDCYLDT